MVIREISQSEGSQFESYVWPIFNSRFVKFVLVLCCDGCEDCEILVEDCDNGGSSSLAVRIKYLFSFQFCQVNFV